MAKRVSEQEEFFNWGREASASDSQADDSAKNQEVAKVQRGAFRTAQSYEEVLVDGLGEDEEARAQRSEQDKGDFVTKNTAYDASQFDSKQSEYFLILNEKNKAIVKKRRLQKEQELDEDLRQFEEEFQKKQQSIMRREEEAF